ncbi:unnamed protein product [Cylicostephanus goldi]|uniref:Uncharacterized protein n=1 Tax=Cylicostephanus goldi TaxID=71465 RepID=A0A3P7NEN8_CYLGO|nr:unnamed protein product [Cylicostephanus goldi]
MYKTIMKKISYRTAGYFPYAGFYGGYPGYFGLGAPLAYETYPFGYDYGYPFGYVSQLVYLCRVNSRI